MYPTLLHNPWVGYTSLLVLPGWVYLTVGPPWVCYSPLRYTPGCVILPLGIPLGGYLSLFRTQVGISHCSAHRWVTLPAMLPWWVTLPAMLPWWVSLALVHTGGYLSPLYTQVGISLLLCSHGGISLLLCSHGGYSSLLSHWWVFLTVVTMVGIHLLPAPCGGYTPPSCSLWWVFLTVVHPWVCIYHCCASLGVYFSPLLTSGWVPLPVVDLGAGSSSRC